MGAIPVLITLAIFTAAGVGYFMGVGHLVDVLHGVPAPEHPGPAGAGFWVHVGHAFQMIAYGLLMAGHWALIHLPAWLFFIVAGAVFVLFTWVTFVIVVNIVGAPWMDALCARVEALAGGHVGDQAGGVRQQFSELATGIKHSLIRLVVYVTGAVVLLLAEWISGGVGTVVVAPVGILWSIVFVALEFADIPESRRWMTMSEKVGVLGRNKAAMLGFGSTAYLALMVPILNVLIIPCAVTGMTLLYLEQVEGRS